MWIGDRKGSYESKTTTLPLAHAAADRPTAGAAAGTFAGGESGRPDRHRRHLAALELDIESRRSLTVRLPGARGQQQGLAEPECWGPVGFGYGDDEPIERHRLRRS